MASIITDGSLGTGSRYSAINSINCLGTEKSLSDCTITSQDDCYPKCTANIAIQCYSKTDYLHHILALFLFQLFNILLLFVVYRSYRLCREHSPSC